MIITLLVNVILWVLIAVFALIILILILPISAELYYDSEKFDFKLKIGFLRVDTLGKWFSNRKSKSGDKKTEKKKKNSEKLKDIQSAAKYVKAFISTSGKIIKMILKSIKFKRLNLKIVVGSEEASKTATTYGAVCAAVYPVTSAFISFSEPKNYDISVIPDFVSEKIKVFIDLKLKTRIISFLIITIKSFMIIRKKLK
ncbi:MAG: DUF2953 domain-containing protein [Clostridia bacterium]|nr:DUF2953 domain-containing protein [Clostridia bacterium]